MIVFDAGRVVQRGPHDRLVRDAESVYGRLYAAWLEQTHSACTEARLAVPLGHFQGNGPYAGMW